MPAQTPRLPTPPLPIFLQFWRSAGSCPTDERTLSCSPEHEELPDIVSCEEPEETAHVASGEPQCFLHSVAMT